MIGPLVLAYLAAQAAAAQDSVPSWRAAIQFTHERFTRDRDPWSQLSLVGGRRFARGSVLGEAAWYSRFAKKDPALGLEGYYPFARRMYGSLRVQLSPGAAVIARGDVALEVFRGIGRGYELSAGYRRMEFSDVGVNIGSMSLARYLGNWYLRARASLSQRTGASGASGSLMVRRYLATEDDLLEAQGGIGQEAVTLSAAPLVIELRGTTFLAGRYQRRVHGAWGVSVGASWNREERIPSRAGGTIGIFTRW